jgi:hypothetical protein
MRRLQSDAARARELLETTERMSSELRTAKQDAVDAHSTADSLRTQLASLGREKDSLQLRLSDLSARLQQRSDADSADPCVCSSRVDPPDTRPQLAPVCAVRGACPYPDAAYRHAGDAARIAVCGGAGAGAVELGSRGGRTAGGSACAQPCVPEGVPVPARAGLQAGGTRDAAVPGLARC